MEVVCSDGTEVKADSVLIGAGVVPNIELAEEAGINCDNGIIVNEFGQTNFKIFMLVEIAQIILIKF